jgi:hypothetical protein
MVAADGALRVALQLERAELHLQGIEEQEPADQRLAGADDELQRLGGLDGAHDAGQHAEHAAFGAARDEARRRRFRIEAAIARAVLRREDRDLAVEPEDAAVHVRPAGKDARVVDEIARREVVGTVHDHVVIAEDFERVRRVQHRLVADHANVRVQAAQPVGRGAQLGPAHVVRAVEDLPLEVAEVHGIEVDETERADAGGGQIERRGGSQPTGADAEHARGLESPLPVDADFRHDQVAAVAANFVVRQLGQRAGRRVHGRRSARH